MRFMKGDTRSLDYSSCGLWVEFRIYRFGHLGSIERVSALHFSF